MAKKKLKETPEIAGKTAFVLAVSWSDRHGPEGPDDPVLFATKASAVKALAKDVARYSKELGIVDDANLVTEYGFHSMSDGSAEYEPSDFKTLADIKAKAKAAALDGESFYINLDDDGTWCRWEILALEIKK